MSASRIWVNSTLPAPMSVMFVMIDSVLLRPRSRKNVHSLRSAGSFVLQRLQGIEAGSAAGGEPRAAPAREEGGEEHQSDRRTELAHPHAAQDDRSHASSASIALLTSLLETWPSSRSIWPSASGRIRSATVETRRSWVTVRIVCP
jgi:hypothetical protein